MITIYRKRDWHFIARIHHDELAALLAGLPRGVYEIEETGTLLIVR